MKNIMKYTAAAAAMIVALSSCEEFEDYTVTVDGAPTLAYVNTGDENLFSTLVSHRPTGSSGNFSTEFYVRCNTPVHAATTVSLVYDASLVENYNAEHETQYAALPEEYLVMENATLTLPENSVQTEEPLRLSLNESADLAALTERYYLAALRIESPGMASSEMLGAVYLLVETETNLIRPITSTDDMAGFPAGDRSEWTADCANFANLFDGSSSTSSSFSASDNVVTIDMKTTHMMTGLSINGGTMSRLSIEYSLDGKSWSQGGTPVDGETVNSGSTTYVAIYDYVEARYLRLTIDFSSSRSASISELDVYMIESTDPTLYLMTGENNLLTGKITHKKGVGSTCDLEAAFKVYTTISSQNGYQATVAADNSLIAAYNEQNGTSYEALPSENLLLENASQTIAGGDNASENEVRISLQGDLSGLTAKVGYLVPLKLTTSSSDAVVSESRGVVYVRINVENNVIRDIDSADDMVGFPAGGSSAWTADCGDAANLFDGNNGTAVSGLSSSGNVITVDMKQTQMVTGLHLYTYGIGNVSIAYSLDGETWDTAGTVADGESVYNGSTWSAGDYYVALADYVEARYLQLSFDFTGWSQNLYEMEVYQIESTDPTIYAQCGADNVLTGTLTHHTVAGAISGVNAAFNVQTTITSPSGFSVGVEVDNSLASTYNAAHGTSYAAMESQYVNLANVPCQIPAGANKSADQVVVTLQGDLSSLTNANGYVIPLRLQAPSGAVVSESRGVVYVTVDVETSSELFRTNFSASSIEGTPVADRSGWKIIACDTEGIHTGTYDLLFDGDEASYIRTWGGPVSFTVDMGREYDMTGMYFVSRSDYGAKYAPNEVMIECSLDGVDYQMLGTPSQSAGSISVSLPDAYIALYGSQKVRYLRINASYGSNMGTGEFNIYAK